MATIEPENPGEYQVPMLLGFMICCPIFGLTCAQTVYYYRHYPNDPGILKSLVAVCATLDTAHLICFGYKAYDMYIRCKMVEKRDGLGWIRESFVAEIVIHVTISGLIGFFYTWRLYRVSGKNMILTSITTLLTITQLVLGLIACDFLRKYNRTIDTIRPLPRVIVPLRLGIAATVDIFFSGSLVYYLRRSRSGYRGTRDVINRLMLFSINVGGVTAVASVVVLALYLALPKTLTYVLVWGLISEFYVNALLVTLNSRQSTRALFNRGIRDAYAGVDIELSNMRPSTAGTVLDIK